MIEDGSGFTSEEVEPLLYSTDINFRPVDLEFGPDGALYLVDWFNPLIGHMQYSLRDAQRDHGHGRIWRVTYKGKPLLDPPNIAGATVPELLDLLKTYEDRTRYRARIELRGRDHAEVADALETWIESLDENHPEFEHHLLEALWVYQTINRPAPELLARVLKSSEPRARAAATRVVRFWRQQIENPVAVLELMARDEHPRVRLEAVVALSHITTPESARAALALQESQTDYYLDYALNETIDTLQPWWQPELAKNEFEVSENALDYLLARVPTNELTLFARNEAVNVELLTRHGVDRANREDALAGLAKASGESRTAVLLDYLGRADRGEVDRAAEVAADLGRLLTNQDAQELAAQDETLLQFAREGRLASVREAAYAALMVADGDAARAWKSAIASTPALVDWLHALPRVGDEALRNAQHARVLPLLTTLPNSLQHEPGPVQARFVRIELPGADRVLTLAEVEVLAAGENIGRSGSAKQSSTLHGGDAKRAIDGNRHASFEKNGQTHTDEEANPWWELDLGAEQPVDVVRIWNRREDVGNRLENYTLTLMDSERRPVFEKAA
ncbi:MAG: HEAT repeat domain-containing protein, partial [Candidatus Hydrogenedentales bacterium]